MGRRRFKGRPINGILLLDKPIGLSSNQALQQVKHLFGAAKAGHTGSLDPLATGMLPVCFGKATKVSAFLLDADKHYFTRVKLGINTTTQDTEGEVVSERSTAHVTTQTLQDALTQFSGEILQIPPMYSALKHNGQRLYQLAREGKEVERKARSITIYKLLLGEIDLPDFTLEIHCSKGTYVRTLAEDIGNTLNCGGHVTALRRTKVGPYSSQQDMVTIDQVKAAAELGTEALDSLLLPVDSALQQWPAVKLSPDSAFYLRQGQAVTVPYAATEGQVRIYDANGFMGVGEILDDGRVAPKKMMS